MPSILDLLAWRAAPPPPWSRFTLLTWNLLADVHLQPAWYPLVHPRDRRPELRHPRLLAALSRLEADVMALQEVDPALLGALCRGFPDHTVHFAPHNGEGIAVLVRGGAARAETLELPGGRKRCVLVTLPGGWTLAAVHLSWTGDPGPDQGRRGLDQLEAVLRRRPDVVCGDFNSFPEWPERRLAAASGWEDATPPGPTCNVHQRLQPLDAVFVRPGWRCAAEPLAAITAYTPMPSADQPSDHLPIRASLVAPGG